MLHLILGVALEARGQLDEAVAEHRAALRLRPEYAEAHTNLGNALAALGQLTEAVAEYRAALRLRPGLAEAHNNLGAALKKQGQLAEAVAEYREALRLRPDYAEAHTNLGNALTALGQLAEAVAEYRAALRLRPDLAEAHNSLGIVMIQQGDAEGAVAALRRARDLARPGTALANDLPASLRQAERQAALAARLPAVLRGNDRPKDASERLEFAQLCYLRQRHAASARFYTEVLAAEPKLGEDRQAQHRYNAACAAALAAAGVGKDAPPDDAARAKLRAQALGWMRAERDVWAKLLEAGTPQSQAAIARTLQHWKADPDLAGVRDAAALAKLPEAERKQWQALWADVAALLARAGGSRP